MQDMTRRSKNYTLSTVTSAAAAIAQSCLVDKDGSISWVLSTNPIATGWKSKWH